MMNMTGMDRDIFRATRRLTTLLNDACNHWNYLCPYLEELGKAANMALEGYQKDYPRAVSAIIAQDRKFANRPLRNCEVGTPQEAYERFSKFCCCQVQLTGCKGCYLYEEGRVFGSCVVKWARMPYMMRKEK